MNDADKVTYIAAVLEGRPLAPFTDRERATVLAALRVFQRTLGVATMDHFADCTPLVDSEIDALCDRLNVD